MQDFIAQLYALLEAYPEVFSFLVALTAGEIGVIFSAFMAASGAFPLHVAALWGWMGMLTMDVFWFLFSRTALYKRAVAHRFIETRYKRIIAHLEHMTGGKDALVLLLSKVFMGTRILVIFFVAARNMSLWRFFGIAALVNGVWIAVLVTLGFLARGGFDRMLDLFEEIQIALAFFVLFWIVLYYSMRKVQRRIFNDH